MKLIIILCPKCKKPMRWCTEAMTTYKVKIKGTKYPEGRQLFGVWK